MRITVRPTGYAGLAPENIRQAFEALDDAQVTIASRWQNRRVAMSYVTS